LAGLLLLLALGAGGFSWLAWQRDENRPAAIGAAIAVLALAGCGIAWFSRPGHVDVNDRLEELLRREIGAGEESGTGPVAASRDGEMVCTLDIARSRATGAASSDVSFHWAEEGCVNEGTQYGLASGT